MSKVNLSKAKIRKLEGVISRIFNKTASFDKETSTLNFTEIRSSIFLSPFTEAFYRICTIIGPSFAISCNHKIATNKKNSRLTDYLVSLKIITFDDFIVQEVFDKLITDGQVYFCSYASNLVDSSKFAVVITHLEERKKKLKKLGVRVCGNINQSEVKLEWDRPIEKSIL